jgi:hypothetical protein
VPDPADVPPGEPPVRQLVYRLTTSDTAAFAALRPRWSARRWWLLPIAAGVVGTVWPLLADGMQMTGDDPRGWLIAVALVLLVVVSGAAADQADKRRRAARIPLPRTPVRVAVVGEGLRMEADGRTSTVGWADIGAVDVTGGHVFVRTGPGDGIILPLRAFAGRAEMEAFAAWVDRRSMDAED